MSASGGRSLTTSPCRAALYQSCVNAWQGPNSALLTDAFSSPRYACGAAKRERWASAAGCLGLSSRPFYRQSLNANTPGRL